MLLPLLRAIVAIANLCLIAATRNLWFGDSSFPMIPLAGGLTDAPLWIDNAFSTLLVTSLLLVAGVSIGDVLRHRRSASERPGHLTAGRRGSFIRLACVLIVVSGTGLALLNQHRLQPWLYHLLLLCPILAMRERPCESPAADRFLFSLSGLVILLTASIYFWSGISKCDRAFIEGHGQTFVSAIANVLGLSLRFWSPEQRSLAAVVLPVGELLVAISLLVPKTRRIGLFASLLMHGLLITAVGPWGMDQRPGVLLWNALFISQNVLLLRYLARQRIRSGTGQQLAPSFATPCATGLASTSSESGREKTSGTPLSHPAEQLETNRLLQLARVVVIVAAIAPLLRFVGWFDNWPSWAVYTAGNEHAYVLIAEASVDRLPPDIRRFVQPRAMNDGWSWLRIDLWSIAAVDAPLYPQKRFFVACGLAMSKLPGMQDSIRILTESSADPLTGERTTKSYASHAELQQLADEFMLNLQPRSAAR